MPCPFRNSLSAALLLSGLLLFPQGALGQETAEGDTAQAAQGLPLEPGRHLSFTAEEGSWISLDVSPDGDEIVFDLLGDLYIMPVTGGEARRLTSGMGFNAQPRFSPDGSRVVFVSDRNGGDNLWILSTDLSDTTQVTTGKHEGYLSPVFTPDGEYVVASKGGRAQKLWLYHVDGGSGVALFTEPENLRATGAAFGPDPRYVWFAERTGAWQYNSPFPQYQLAVYDRERGTRTAMTSRYGSAFRPALSPDGNWLVYGTRHAAETGLRIRHTESGEERWLAFPVQKDDKESVAELDVLPGYAFTPDSRFVVTSYGGKIWRVPVEGSGAPENIPFTVQVERELGPEVRFTYAVEDDPTLVVRQIRDAKPSPDGSRVAFTALNSLYVMDLPDGTPRLLAEGREGHHQPTWSPDGRHLAYVTWHDELGGHVWRISADGGAAAPQRLSTLPAYYRDTAWSPDGERVVVIQAAARDVQENLGGFGGGLAQEVVWFPATGGAAQTVMPADGRRYPHFSEAFPERVFLSGGSDGLISVRWDGTDERTHLKVTGGTVPGAEEPLAPSTLHMGPSGKEALVAVGMDLYLVTVPVVGPEAATVSVADPSASSFPVLRLSDLGGQFPVWGADGAAVHWSIGRTFFSYDLEVGRDQEDEEGEDGYVPAEVAVSIEVARDRPEGVAVLRGGRAITMRGDEIIDNADIVIRDNRIVAVGPRGSVEIPAGAHEVDVSGRTVVPGFVDVHYHTQWLITDVHNTQVWQYLTNLAYGMTLAHDVQTATTDILTYQDLVAAGRMLGPRISHTGPGVFSRDLVRDLDHARTILRRYKEHYRVNTFKMYMSGNREQRQWLIQAARELELMPTVEAGLQFKLNLTQAMDGYPGLEHSLPIYPLFSDVRELFVTTQMTYTPTLLVSYGGPWAEDYFFATEDIFGDAKIRHFTPWMELESKASRRGGGGGRAGWFHRDEHIFDRHAEFVRDLVEAGGRVGIGAHGQFHGLGYHWELWAMQSGGLSEHDALRAATIMGAEAIGFGDDLGSLEPGKLADLVVLGADPLENIRNSADVEMVMKNGRLYDAATLDEVWPQQRPLPSFLWQQQEPEVNTGLPARIR